MVLWHMSTYLFFNGAQLALELVDLRLQLVLVAVVFLDFSVVVLPQSIVLILQLRMFANRMIQLSTIRLALRRAHLQMHSTPLFLHCYRRAAVIELSSGRIGAA